MMKVRKLLSKECDGYLAMVVDTTMQVGVELEDVPILRKFLDVFSDNIQGFPPERKVSFTIDLTLSTTLISKIPYRIVLTKL